MSSHYNFSVSLSTWNVVGSKIKALRAKTNTYIKTPVRGEEPVFVVTGRREDVAAAKREILSASEHFSQIRASRLSAGAGSPGVSGRAPGQLSAGETGGQVTIHVRVPYRVVGLVVGPKGATIKRIQQDSATYIVTPSRDREPVFEVTGTCDGVEKARRDIESYIALRTGAAAPPSDTLQPALPPPSQPLMHGGDVVDPRVLLNSLLKSAGPGHPGSSAAALGGATSASVLALNNAVNAGCAPRHLAHHDVISNNGAQQGLGLSQLPYGPGQSEYRAAPGVAGGSGTAPRLFDYDALDIHNNNSTSSMKQLVEGGGWPGSVNLDLRSLAASLLPPAQLKPTAMLDLDLLTGYPGSLDMAPSGHVYPDLAGGLVTAGTGSSASSSGSPPGAASPHAHTGADSPGLVPGSVGVRQGVRVPGCVCLLCGDAPVSAALVPCGHNMFCKTCADGVVSTPDLADRRCPVCGELASLAIKIIS